MDLRTFRLAERLTLREIAERIGVAHPRTVHRYETGRIPKPDVMARIVQATGGKVRPEDFYPSAGSQPMTDLKSEAA